MTDEEREVIAKKIWHTLRDIDYDDVKAVVDLIYWDDISPQNKSIDKLRHAIDDYGIRPDIHSRELRRLKKKWPTLWNAIKEVTDLDD